MTMPFRFAPGCCDPCGPVCGVTYTPEQFTVVSGTYDTATHTLSPGGVIAVPYTGTNVYLLVANKIQVNSSGTANESRTVLPADVAYIFGAHPIVITQLANSFNATISHGDHTCSAYVSNYVSSENRIYQAKPESDLGTSTAFVYVTPEGFYMVYEWEKFDNNTRNTVTLESLFSENLPYIRNDGSESVQVDEIVLYENQDSTEPACQIVQRCSGYYHNGSGYVAYSKDNLFDNISSLSVSLSGTGAILSDISGNQQLYFTDCEYGCRYRTTTPRQTSVTFQAPMFNDRFVLNLSKFAYPDEIEWVPFTLNLDVSMEFLPLNESSGILSVSVDSGDCAFSPSLPIVAGWRYNDCPAAKGVWKNTADDGTRPYYCWSNKNANTYTNSDIPNDANKIRIFATGSARIAYEDINFETGTSEAVSIPLTLQTFKDSIFPLSYNGTVLPNTSGRILYEHSSISDWPGLEPCAEGYKYCPYCQETFYNQAGSISSYFTGKSITAMITGLNRVL